jgi:hypothetical protein
MPVTIHNLDVRFDEEGEGDEAVFARRYTKYSKRREKEREDENKRHKRADCERSLGDKQEEHV